MASKNNIFEFGDFESATKYRLNNKLFIYYNISDNSCKWIVLDIDTEEIIVNKKDNNSIRCTGIIYHDEFFYCIYLDTVYRTNIETLHWEKYKTLSKSYTAKDELHTTIFSTTDESNNIKIYVFYYTGNVGMYILDFPSFEEMRYIPYPGIKTDKYPYSNSICQCCKGCFQRRCDSYSMLIKDKIILSNDLLDTLFDTETLSFNIITIPQNTSSLFFLSINDKIYYYHKDNLCILNGNDKFSIGPIDIWNIIAYYDDNIITLIGDKSGKKSRKYESLYDLVIQKIKK